MSTSSFETDFNVIFPGIILGSCYHAENLATLAHMNITHILTINYFPTIKRVENIIYHFIEARDDSDMDLLSHFEETFLFLNEALKNEESNVYVHCVAGMSRSPTVVIAFLMKRNALTFLEALDFVKERRNVINPNPGFLAQLKLYESMGCQFNVNNVEYRQFKLEILQRNQEQKYPWDMDSLRKSLLKLCTQDFEAPEASSISYKCRKCRNILCERSDILPHSFPTDYCIWSPWLKLQEGPDCELSLFIQPLPWMLPSINDRKGELLCPKCKSKVGHYSCYGMKCSCGKKMSLSFWMDKNRLDIICPPPPREN